MVSGVLPFRSCREISFPSDINMIKSPNLSTLINETARRTEKSSVHFWKGPTLSMMAHYILSFFIFRQSVNGCMPSSAAALILLPLYCFNVLIITVFSASLMVEGFVV